AEMHVRSADDYFKKFFGVPPRGIWPAEGAVSQEILGLLSKHGIQWTATDEKILARSEPGGLSRYSPYVVKHRRGQKKPVAVFFRDTELSDKVGFVYKDYEPRAAAEDFIQTLLKHSPKKDQEDRIVTVILDGENAWEWYRHDPEGRGFLRALYHKLTELYRERRVITVTPTEYLEGNPKRSVPAHPIQSLPTIEKLWPGSWINANFDTWIGVSQKNVAWDFLRAAHEALVKSGISPPSSLARPRAKGAKKWYAYRAWEELLAAEGSDWFWWIGSEQGNSREPGPMTRLFVQHVRSIYEYANRAGAHLALPDFRSLAYPSQKSESSVGTMRRSDSDLVTVKFQCDARHVDVRDAIYIVGNHPALGAWVPNRIRMYDDGTHGDQKAGDGIWAVELAFPVGTEIQYKFTNSGKLGNWNPGEEFQGLNRKSRIGLVDNSQTVLFDVFGKL
ncbi:MAG: carbohydrate-binding module family 20 domain-containing protein, partial [Bacteroidota bacterium]